MSGVQGIDNNRVSVEVETEDPTSNNRASHQPRPAAVLTRVGVHPGRSAHVVDHGGRILNHVDVAPVYVGDYWQTAAGSADRSHNDAAMANLVRNKGITGLWRQYGAGTGTTSSSRELGSSNPTRMTQASLESLIKRQVAEGRFDTSNPERVFLLVLPPGCELVTFHGESSRSGLGGFHSSVTVGGRQVYYAAMGYPEELGWGRRNGIDFAGNAKDNLSIAESHEITEAVTDPDIGLADRTHDDSKLGWYDDQTRWSWRGSYQLHRGKGEVGDIPVLDAQLGGDPSLKSAWGRSEGFAFQKEWSEKDGQSELKPKR